MLLIAKISHEGSWQSRNNRKGYILQKCFARREILLLQGSMQCSNRIIYNRSTASPIPQKGLKQDTILPVNSVRHLPPHFNTVRCMESQYILTISTGMSQYNTIMKKPFHFALLGGGSEPPKYCAPLLIYFQWPYTAYTPEFLCAAS